MTDPDAVDIPAMRTELARLEALERPAFSDRVQMRILRELITQSEVEAMRDWPPPQATPQPGPEHG